MHESCAVVLLDCGLPDVSNDEDIKRFCRLSAAPVILMSGMMDCKRLADELNCEFVCKDNLSQLRDIVERVAANRLSFLGEA